MNNTVKKVRKWAESNIVGSRFVSNDSNVTYEGIIKLCDMVGVPTPVSVSLPKKEVKKMEGEDGSNKPDNRSRS